MAKIKYVKTVTDAVDKLVGVKKKEVQVNKESAKENKKVESSYRSQVDILKELVKGQNRMIQGMNSLIAATKGTARSTKRLNQQNLLWVKNTRILGGSLAVLRSKLLVFTFGIGLLERSIGKLLEAYGDFEESQERITRVISSTGGAAGLTANEVFAMNAAFEKSTGIAETTINQSSSILLTFTNLGQTIFPETQQAVLDMTAALYHGNVTMEALKTTSIQVGKALNDPIRGLTALRRVGVSFNARQKLIIKALQNTNRLAQAQGIILDELEREFGGQSEIQRYNKSVLELGTAFGNLAKRIGEDLRPAIEPMIQSLTKLVNAIDASEVIDFTKSFIGLTLALAGVKKALQLGLLASGRSIKSMKRLGKVAKLIAFNMIGLTSSVRKGTTAVKIMTVAFRALSGMTGIGLLVAVLLPQFLSMFDDVEEKTKDVGSGFEDAKLKLNVFNKSFEAAEGSKDKLMKLARSLNMVSMFTSAYTHTVESLTEKLKGHQVQLEKDLKLEQDYIDAKKKGQGVNQQANSDVTDMTQGFKDQLFVLKASVDENGTVIKSKQTMAKAVSELAAHINVETGENLSLIESQQLLDPALRNSIEAYTDYMDTLELVRQQKKLDIASNKETMDSYSQVFSTLSSGVTQFLEFDLNRWEEGEISKLEKQKDNINSTIKNEKNKEKALKKIDDQIEAAEKKAHNKALVIKGLDLTMDLFTSIAKINIATATAKAMANLLPPGLREAQKLFLESSKMKQIAVASVQYGIGIAGLAAQKAALGADFTTTGPQLMMVGDNPGGRERVQVTPLSSPNVAGPQGEASVIVNVSGNVLTQDFVEDELAEHIKEAVRRGTDFGIG